MRHARKAVIALVATSLLLAGCPLGGKQAPGPTSTPTAKPVSADRDLTDEQMASLTLPLDDYGPRYAAFVPDEDSGLLSLTGRALQACQARIEAGALSKYGWARGYARGFNPPDLAVADTIGIATYIDIYSNDDSAAGKLQYDYVAIRDDTRAFQGCFGYTVEGVDDIPVSGVGEQVVATRERFSNAGIRGSISVLRFRRGKVVVSVQIVRMTSEDATDELIALAKKLDGRLQPLLGAPLS